MVSASDFGYIPTVVFVAYMGGKGNRAKWIGAGCILISVANIIISSSNFLFPVETVNLENSEFEKSIERDLRRLPDVNVTFYNKLSPNVRQQFYQSGVRNFFDSCDRLHEANKTDAACDFVQVTHQITFSSYKSILFLNLITVFSNYYTNKITHQYKILRI